MTARLPGGRIEISRREEATRRLTIIEGDWRRLAGEQMERRYVGAQLAEMGEPVASRNLARYLIHELSALYWQPPGWSSSEVDSPEFADWVNASKWWRLAQRNQRRALSLRESMVRLSVSPSTKALQVRLVRGDFYYAEAHPDDPTRPVLVIECRDRVVTWESQTKRRPCWDVLDLRDPNNPVYRVSLANSESDIGAALKKAAEQDVSDQVLGEEFQGGAVGEKYPYRFRAEGDGPGRPFLPYVLYHAEHTGELHDPHHQQEAYEGTLDQSTLWTFWHHGVMRASWEQRVIIDGMVAGLSVQGEGETQRAYIQTSPTSVLNVKSDGNRQARIDKWGPSTDPYNLGGAIAEYEQHTGTYLGVGPGDFQASKGAQSGLSIALKRTAIRERQRAVEDQFRDGDQELLAKAAALWRTLGNEIAAEAEDPEQWSLSYPGLPLSQEEREQIAAETERLVAMGAKPSRLYVLQRALRISRDEALDLLRQWAEDAREELQLGFAPAA